MTFVAAVLLVSDSTDLQIITRKFLGLLSSVLPPAVQKMWNLGLGPALKTALFFAVIGKSVVLVVFSSRTQCMSVDQPHYVSDEYSPLLVSVTPEISLGILKL
jgi:uncharacterized membrane protein YeaQ/YmgE (transglycosylase-associated protein family)